MCVLCFGRNTGRLHQVVFFAFVKCCFSIGLIIWYVFNVHIFNMKKNSFSKKVSLWCFTCYFCAGMLQHGLFRFGGWFGGEGDRGMNLFISSPPLNWIGCCMGLSLSLSPPFLPPGIENDPQERKRPFKCNSLANGYAVVLTIPFF